MAEAAFKHPIWSTRIHADFPHDPQLSVVIAATPSYAVTHCLESLIPQCAGKSVEIIVSGHCRDDIQRKFSATHPAILFLPAAPTGTLPALWGAGIAQAKGGIIALTDSTCVVDKDWVAAILQAHQSDHPVIGGAVEMHGRASLVDWAAYFCEYGQFARPLDAGEAGEVAGNNISFKRAALDKGEEFVRPGFWKTYWCRHLQREGIALFITPSIVVFMHKSYRLAPFLTRRFHHGRCFAGMRLAQLPPLKRACYVLGSPLLPFVFAARTVQSMLPKTRHRRKFIQSLPISLLAILSWSWGECCGYLAGPGSSCSHIV